MRIENDNHEQGKENATETISVTFFSVTGKFAE